VGARQPLVVAQPGCDAAVYLGRIARKLDNGAAPEPA